VAITEREGRHRHRERGALHDLPRPDESVDDGTPAAGRRTKYYQFTAIDDGMGIVDVPAKLVARVRFSQGVRRRGHLCVVAGAQRWQCA
jgi:hypothetical protein